MHALGQWRDRGVLHVGPLLAGGALVIIAVLVFKPSGLFGRTVVVRV